MGSETVYSEVPVDVAVTWFNMGAERLHLVDLDGAVQGKPINKGVIRDIVRAVAIPAQLGGGIRDMKSIEAYLDIGIRWIVLGTVGFKDPGFVSLACREFPEKIILGIDAKKGRVAVEGWTKETDRTAAEVAEQYEAEGVSAIVYTDIERDGMRVGPNVKATQNLAKSVSTPVIASGGISDIDDVVKLLSLSEHGVIGMITGRAIYEGTLDLREAMRVTRGHKN
jgi:phosphoribosylformimino-5-aminoimidazole carboxamide ribotide isomerase